MNHTLSGPEHHWKIDLERRAELAAERESYKPDTWVFTPVLPPPKPIPQPMPYSERIGMAIFFFVLGGLIAVALFQHLGLPH